MKYIITIYVFMIFLSITATDNEKFPIWSDDFENMVNYKLFTVLGAKATFKKSSKEYKMGRQSGCLKYQFPNKQSGVIISKSCKIDAIPSAISFWLYGDNSRNWLALRLTDATGEVFRYRLGILKWAGWQLQNIDITQNANMSHWGGNKDGKLDLPLKAIAFEVKNFAQWGGKSRSDGTVYFDNMKIYSKVAAKKLMTSSSNYDKIIRASYNNKIKLDGKLDDWITTNPIKLSGKLSHLVSGSFDDDRDGSVFFYINYDNKNLYFGAKVKDDRIVCPYSKLAIWQNDGFELWFDCNRDSLLHLGQSDDYQLGITPSSANGTPGFFVWRNPASAYLMASAKVKSQRTLDGYTIEAAIPLDAMEGLLNEDKAIGFNLSFCDNDGNSYSRLLWSGKEIGRPVSFGILTFGKLPKAQLKKLVKRRKLLVSSQLKDENNTNNAINRYLGEPQITKIKVIPDVKKKYSKVEFSIDLQAEYKNPFDYNDLTVEAELTSPSGKHITVDGFYFQNYRLRFGNKRGEKLTKYGAPSWKVRYTPIEVGTYSYKLRVSDAKGRTDSTKTRTFNVVRSDAPGFLRVSPADHDYLEFDSGRKFFGLGFASHLWHKKNSLIYTMNYFNQLAAFSCNYTSINFETLSDCGFSLENKQLKRYSLSNAFRIDFILKAAAKRNLYLIPCLNQTHLAMSKYWNVNKFNSTKGGPCKTASDYFSSPASKSIIKNRLRYIIARWGYSPNILGWELFNEVNYTEAFQKNRQAVIDFHREMGDYLKKIDPNKHLIGTSFGSSDSCEAPAIWQLPQIDFTITHSYTKDIAKAIYQRQTVKSTYHKPNIGGENGHSWPEADKADILDPDGIALHNNIWSSALAKCAGNILLWWPFRYHGPLDIYEQFQYFSRFETDINWGREGFKRMRVNVYKNSSPTTAHEIIFDCKQQWKSPSLNPYYINKNGLWTLTPLKNVKANFTADTDRWIKITHLPGIIFGHDNPSLNRKIVINIDSPVKSSATLKICSVATAGTSLQVMANNHSINKLKIVDTDAKNNPYAQELNKSVQIPLVKGNNIIELKNYGRGWLGLKSLTLKNFSKNNLPNNVRAFVLKGSKTTIAWLQNSKNTWYLQSLRTPLKTIKNCYIKLPKMAPGNYTVEWWDTWSGKIISSEKIILSEKILQLTIPSFSKDIALKIKKH